MPGGTSAGEPAAMAAGLADALFGWLCLDFRALARRSAVPGSSA
jgi:hypothetical protein